MVNLGSTERDLWGMALPIRALPPMAATLVKDIPGMVPGIPGWALEAMGPAIPDLIKAPANSFSTF